MFHETVWAWRNNGYFSPYLFSSFYLSIREKGTLGMGIVASV